MAAIILGVGGGLLLTGSAAAPVGAQSTASQHYLCYVATAKKGFTIPSGVRLVNGFAPNGFIPTFGPAQEHCNPAEKIVGGTVYEITNPTWHYLCFKITSKEPTTTATVTNQFGKALLAATTPTTFCVPSWKSLTGPPKEKPSQPPGTDHYTCYPVSYVKGTSGKFKPPGPVQVSDEFSPGGPVGVTVGAPQTLCVPTEKILPSGVTYPINNPSLNYLCFKVSATPIVTPVFDENQFGTGTVTVKKTKSLCLPSTVTPTSGSS